MSTKLSLTLNFGEEDEPLLTFLRQFPKDEWESILKDALHFFVDHSVANDSHQEKKQEVTHQGWNLEDLFVSPSAMACKTITDGFSETNDKATSANEASLLDACGRLDSDQSSKSPEAMPNITAYNPLGHLFELIGQEEDKEVLEFFIHSNAQSKYESGVMDDSVTEKKENLKSKGADSLLPQGDEVKTASFKGLDFLLSQVIGEEDDPEVLDFFKRTDKRE